MKGFLRPIQAVHFIHARYKILGYAKQQSYIFSRFDIECLIMYYVLNLKEPLSQRKRYACDSYKAPAQMIYPDAFEGVMCNSKNK